MENFFIFWSGLFHCFYKQPILSALAIPLLLLCPYLVGAHCCTVILGHLKLSGCFWARHCDDGHSMCKFWVFFFPVDSNFWFHVVFCLRVLYPNEIWWQCSPSICSTWYFLSTFPWQTWSALLEDTSSFIRSIFSLPQIPVMIWLLQARTLSSPYWYIILQ